MAIKAIETNYKNRRFRSRTEARWAVYFDALGLKWEYEHEGYELPGGRYLPDFWFPDIDTFAEVKGRNFTGGERYKCEQLVESTGSSCLMLNGQPDGRSMWIIHAGNHSGTSDKGTWMDDVDMSLYLDERRFYSCVGNRYPEQEYTGLGETCPAVKAALGARFEHGESGAKP